MVRFDDFKKLSIKIAKVIKVEDHPNADKLYILTVTTGEAEKVIVAGIRQYYKPNELIGKSIVLVDNLESANIRGTISNGMLLAAKDDKTLAILVPDKEIKVGSTVS
jgi:methionyl-tRNA synthetase